MKNNNYDITTGKPAKLSPLQKMYLELEKIIEPRLLDDFCGYNEEMQGFDLVLATKQIIEAKEQECQQAMDNYIQLDLQRVKEYNELVDLYKAKEQECEKLKKKLKPKLKNAHCVYFDGQTGWCKAKEFIRCNPIGCKLYTIDELSTIVDLQEQLKRKEQECNRYKQTLMEIQQDLEYATYCESQECGCDDPNECLECTKNQILQKISEVEDDR